MAAANYARRLVKTAGVRRTHLHGLWTTDHFVWQAPRAWQHYFDMIFVGSFLFINWKGNEQPRMVCIIRSLLIYI
jgi:hypothetical protein